MSLKSIVHSQFPIFLYLLGLFMLTLYPYQFSTQPRPWDFDKSLLDMVQNIILFLPLGLLIHQNTRLKLWYIAMLGAGISLSIELVQLFSLTRFSNPFDIVANAAGAVIGAWTSSRFLRKEPYYASISMLLLLLCWALGMRSSSFDVALCAFFIAGTAGLVALIRSLHSSGILNGVVRFAWSALAVGSLRAFEPLLRLALIPVLLITSALFVYKFFKLKPFQVLALFGLFLIPVLVLTAIPLQLPFPFEIRLHILWLLMLYSFGLAYFVLQVPATGYEDIPLQS